MNPSRAQEKYDERYSIVMRIIVKAIELVHIYFVTVIFSLLQPSAYPLFVTLFDPIKFPPTIAQLATV